MLIQIDTDAALGRAQQALNETSLYKVVELSRQQGQSLALAFDTMVERLKLIVRELDHACAALRAQTLWTPVDMKPLEQLTFLRSTGQFLTGRMEQYRHYLNITRQLEDILESDVDH